MPENSIKFETLRHLLKNAGHSHVISSPKSEKDEIANGKLSFCNLPQGIGMHLCDVVETSSASSSSELFPSINITVLMEGKVDFGIGLKRFSLETQNAPIVFANIINHDEIFSRHMSKGQRVKKVTITLSHQWLLDRLPQSDPRCNLLEGANRVIHLVPTTNLIDAAKTLFSLSQIQHDAHHSLQFEILCLTIVDELLSSFSNEDATAIVQEKVVTSEKNIASIKLKNDVERLALSALSLNEIADAMSMSPSTLQRRFKAAFKETVQEHIRAIKLEQAKKSLLLEGLSIGEVAFQAGYRHSANFVTAFKKHFNITPSELRRKHYN